MKDGKMTPNIFLSVHFNVFFFYVQFFELISHLIYPLKQSMLNHLQQKLSKFKFFQTELCSIELFLCNRYL